MKLQLNFGDWATIAFLVLGTVLGCYARSAGTVAIDGPSTVTANTLLSR